MSTKRSIKWKDHTDAGPGFHLYDDLLDDLRDAANEPPVYLQLDGVHVKLMTFCDVAGASMTVTIPRAVARELGLLTMSDKRSDDEMEKTRTRSQVGRGHEPVMPRLTRRNDERHDCDER